MKILLGVAFAVLALYVPAVAQSENAVHFRFSGVVQRIETTGDLFRDRVRIRPVYSIADLARLPEGSLYVGVDPRWVVSIVIDEAGSTPELLRAGSRFVFVIHSPTRTFPLKRDDAVGKSFLFELDGVWESEGRLRFMALSARRKEMANRPEGTTVKGPPSNHSQPPSVPHP